MSIPLVLPEKYKSLIKEDQQPVLIVHNGTLVQRPASATAPTTAPKISYDSTDHAHPANMEIVIAFRNLPRKQGGCVAVMAVKTYGHRRFNMVQCTEVVNGTKQLNFASHFDIHELKPSSIEIIKFIIFQANSNGELLFDNIIGYVKIGFNKYLHAKMKPLQYRLVVPNPERFPNEEGEMPVMLLRTKEQAWFMPSIKNSKPLLSKEAFMFKERLEPPVAE